MGLIPEGAQIGWKLWAVRDGMLTGPISGCVWPTGTPCRANHATSRVCAATTREGIDELIAAWGSRWDTLVAGRVALWGRVEPDLMSACSPLLTADCGYPISVDEVSFGADGALAVLRANYGI